MLHSHSTTCFVVSDLIEIGIDAVLVFQASARNMDARSMTVGFGGKIVFYEGIYVENLLRQGNFQEVKETVKSNRMAFDL